MDREVKIYTILALLLLTGCYNTFEPLGESEGVVAPLSNIKIKHLHELYDSGIRDIRGDVVTTGTVTANDQAGNIFMSFIIEHEGYSIEVLDGIFDSYVRHPTGAQIILKLNGLRLDKERGVLRAGLPADNSSPFELEYMRSEAIIDKYILLVECGAEPSPKLSTARGLRSITPGALVRLDSLKYHSEDMVQSQWAGLKLFRTPALDSLWCDTSEYAQFAFDFIPMERLSLTGIYQTEGDKNIIKLRSEEDCIY